MQECGTEVHRKFLAGDIWWHVWLWYPPFHLSETYEGLHEHNAVLLHPVTWCWSRQGGQSNTLTMAYKETLSTLKKEIKEPGTLNRFGCFWFNDSIAFINPINDVYLMCWHVKNKNTWFMKHDVLIFFLNYLRFNNDQKMLRLLLLDFCFLFFCPGWGAGKSDDQLAS